MAEADMLLRYSTRAGNRIIRPDDRRPGDLSLWTPVVTVWIHGGSIVVWLDWPRSAELERASVAAGETS